jgi:NTE family protein
VSDGGGQMQPEGKPKKDWARHALRINGLIDNQVRALRKRQVVGSFQAKERKGTYWGIRRHVADYGLADALDCPPEKTLILANLQTRLKRLDRTTQERLINWGYAICDTGMRKWVLLGVAKPASLPCPGSGLG